MHIHLIGVAGTGMGSLAVMLKAMGHHVTGSDTAFYPPMGDMLQKRGITLMEGFKAEHLHPKPDRVVVGNVCRRDNPEAQHAISLNIPISTFPHTLAEEVIKSRPSWVIAGTHGKTTTTTLVAYFLEAVGAKPGYLIGGVPVSGAPSAVVGDEKSPFVVEGDEYDSAFFEKTPKFWHYGPHVAILTSIEHDHIDIYPDPQSYRHAFEEFVRRIPPTGLLVAYGGDPEVREVAKLAACPVRFYALTGDDIGDADIMWLGAAGPVEDGMLAFELYAGGVWCGRAHTPMLGRHNLLNLIAAIALVTEGHGVSVNQLVPTLPKFTGIKRRQELIGTVNNIRVYDDFAHHPTAVRETVSAMRQFYPQARLIAVYEPRSATASRNLHQTTYPQAFAQADEVFLAPVGRKEVLDSERLDIHAIATDILALGRHAQVMPSIDILVSEVAKTAHPGDVIVVMSNGAFEGAARRILNGLSNRV